MIHATNRDFLFLLNVLSFTRRQVHLFCFELFRFSSFTRMNMLSYGSLIEL